MHSANIILACFFLFPHHVFHLYVCAWTDILEARFDLNDPTSLLSFACFFSCFLWIDLLMVLHNRMLFHVFFGWIDLLSVLPNLFFASFRLLLLYFHFDLTFIHWKALLKQDLIAWDDPLPSVLSHEGVFELQKSFIVSWSFFSGWCQWTDLQMPCSLCGKNC